MGKKAMIKKNFIRQRYKSESEDMEHNHLNQNEQENRIVHEDTRTAGEFIPPDGGWGWVVCLASLWANGVVHGIINTFGIVYVQMRDKFSAVDPDISMKTAFVGSTFIGMTFLMCTVASILNDKWGIRPTAFTGAVLATAGLLSSAFIQKLELLYVTFGIILGIGSAFVYSPSLVILGHYFKKHLGLVNGIVTFGSSLFTVALTRILPALLSSIGIKYVFLFLAALQVCVCLFTLSWKPLMKKEEHTVALTDEIKYKNCNGCCSWIRRFLNVKIWRNKSYVVWVGSLIIALFGLFVPYTHLPQHTLDTFPGEDGSWLILCLSITSGVSRIVCGKVADLPWISRIKMQQVAFVVLGLSTLCIPFSGSFGGLIGISLVMGVCDGIFVCLLGPIAFDIVGPGEASQALGFLLGLFSIPFTIGPPVAGWMYDALGDYKMAFHVSGAPPIIGALIMFLMPKVQQSYPAVTETMEFASISMMDVYNEVRVPKDKQMATAVKNGGPSGPATELELIQSSDLLYLGGNKPRYITRPQVTTQNEEESREIINRIEDPREVTIEVKIPRIDQDDTEDTTPMLKAADDSNEDFVKDDINPNDSVITDNNPDKKSVKSAESVENNETVDKEKVLVETNKLEEKVTDEEDNLENPENTEESSSLLQEVEKYLEASKAS